MSDNDTSETASDAYVYFYPIVQNLKTFFFASVWPHTTSYGGPVNQFRHATQLVDWRFTSVVSPNNDTLYSQAWLDLDQQPIVLGLPDVPTVAGKRVRKHWHHLPHPYKNYIIFDMKTLERVNVIPEMAMRESLA